MKYLILVIAVMCLNACSSSMSSIPEWVGDQNPNRYGYKSYDPCFRCGESWIFLKNAPAGPNDQAKLGRHGN